MICERLFLDTLEPTETPLLVPDGRGGWYKPKGFIVTPKDLRLSYPEPFWAEMMDRIISKNQKRIIVPDLAEGITGETVADLGSCFIGPTSIYSVRSSTRYLAPSTCGITNGELTRTILKYELELAEKRDGKRVAYDPRAYDTYLDFPAPGFYEPGPLDGRWRGSFAYVDLSQAYWTNQRTSTMDMRFVPGRYVMTGRAEFKHAAEITLRRDLRLRHLIPGTMRIKKMEVYNKGKMETRDLKTPLYRPGITGYNMYIMNSIAREVIDHFDAKMWLVDAAIVPEEYADAVVEFLWDRWNVTGVIQARGEGALYGKNCYQIGAKRTGHAPRSWTAAPSWLYTTSTGKTMTKEPNCSGYDNIMEVDSRWIQNKRRILLDRSLGCDTA